MSIQHDFFVHHYAKAVNATIISTEPNNAKLTAVHVDVPIEKNPTNEKIITALADSVVQNGAEKTFEIFHSQFSPNNSDNIVQHIKEHLETKQNNNAEQDFKTKLLSKSKNK